MGAREEVRALPPAPDDGQDPAEETLPEGVSRPGSHLEADPAARQALERGLAWLAARQAETRDGGMPKGDAVEWAPIGVTSIATLAFMAGGNSPGRGPHGDAVARAVDYLLAHADLAPESRERGFISNQGDAISRMHGHGFATLALAEAYGMSPPSERLRRALVAAVEVIQSSQSPEGGWAYEPRPSGHEGSVTVCLVQALRAARNSGIQIDPTVVRRAEDYVLALRNEEGLFRYQLDRTDASVALTAAGIATLNMAGRYDGSVIQDGVVAIWNGMELRAQGERSLEAKFPYYERLYLAQAFWQLSDTSHFERWWSEERRRVLGTQEADGSWRDEEKRYGSVYATAVNCLVLAIPDGLLPIYQR